LTIPFPDLMYQSSIIVVIWMGFSIGTKTNLNCQLAVDKQKMGRICQGKQIHPYEKYRF